MKKRLLAIILVVVIIGTTACSAKTEDINVLELIFQANQNETLVNKYDVVAYRAKEYYSDGYMASFYNYADKDRIVVEEDGTVTIYENDAIYGFDNALKVPFVMITLGENTVELPAVANFGWSPDEVVTETYQKNGQLIVHSQSKEESLQGFLNYLGYEYDGEAEAFNEYTLDPKSYEILGCQTYAVIPGMEGKVMIAETERVSNPQTYDSHEEIRALVFSGPEFRNVSVIADPDTENETVYSKEISKGCIAHVYMSPDHPYLYSDRACTQRYDRNGEDYDSDMILFTKAEPVAFAYEHDPRLNPSAMEDIIENPDAVYGFSPNPESKRLGTYAEYDWTNPEVVEQGRLDRLAYHESLYTMYDILHEMRDAGSSIEEMARAVSAERNRLRLESYKDDPEGLAKVKQSNLETYGDENGPTADSLHEKYGSWETVLQKAFSTNAGMDACVGLYDTYYTLYVELGMIQE